MALSRTREAVAHDAGSRKAAVRLPGIRLYPAGAYGGRSGAHGHAGGALGTGSRRPQALTAAEVERTREALHRAAENDALEQVLAQDEIFVDMVDHPAILPVVRAVVGDDVMLRYAFGGVRVANTDSGGGWHCDLSNITSVYLPDSPIMTKVYTYLADVPENGATLALVPGSHRFEMGRPLPDIAEHEDMPHHVKLVAKAGDAVLFNGYCWHARFHNRSNCDREVLEVLLRPFLDAHGL